jgi:hypothetical protein
MSPFTAVNPSESAAENAVDLKMPAPGDKGYDEWRKTGRMPSADDSEAATEEKEEVEEKPETQVQEQEEPSSEEEASAASEHESEEIAAPEAARPQKGKKDAAARLREVLEERKADRALLRKLTEKLAVLEAPTSVKPESRPAAETETTAKSEAKPEPQIDDRDAKGQPKFKTYGEYQNAWRQWVHEEAVRAAREEATSHTTKAQQEQQKTQADRTVDEKWTAKLNKAREKLPNFDANLKKLLEARDANGNEFFFARSGAIDTFLQDSDLGAEVFHYIAEHSDTPEVQHIFERTPDGKFFLLSGVQQVRALTKIEAKLEATAAAQAKAAVPKVPPAKKISNAPPPPHQVSGKPAGQVDEVEQAVKDGDQEAYTRQMNDKILEKARQGRRRA